MESCHRHQKTFDMKKSFRASASFLLFLLLFLGSFITVLVLLRQFDMKNDFVGDVDGCARRLENATSRLRDMVAFLPLKDPGFAAKPREGRTWFVSSLDDTIDGNSSEYIRFPSEGTTKGRLLCIAGHDGTNGTRNAYGLAWPDSLPEGATLLGGLTFVSDTYYDYRNIWHGLSTVVPIVGWHKFKGCAVPARLVLFHWGELRTRMATWLQSVVDATFGRKMEIERLDRDGSDGPTTCFEEAVVFRHNEGAMPKSKRREVYDMIRCRAREYCNITPRDASNASGVVRLTLFLRVGPRSFRNDSAVIEIFKERCDNVDGCRMRVMRPNNLTFCDQVRLMSETDVLVSQHGAQLTNMIFMDKNSSVMEFFPKGWLRLAGAGQYVFHWMADWSGMRHEGVWRDGADGGGTPCPFAETDHRCLTYYKNWRIGHDRSQVGEWASKVLARMKQHKLELAASARGTTEPASQRSTCSCG